jgi:peroxiredoxin
MKLQSFIIVLFSLITACQNADNKLSKKLNTVIGNTPKLDFSNAKKDSIQALIWSKTHPPFAIYTTEGEPLTAEYLQKNKINMTIDAYGIDTQNIQAVVYRKITKEELDALFAESKKENSKNRNAVELMVNQSAPNFTATDVKGEDVNLEKLRGKVVVMNFWFINCHACVKEMPELNQIKKEFQSGEVEFIGLTFDDLPKTNQFLQKTTFDYRIIANAKSLFSLFNVSPCPVNLVIDKYGKIVFSELGYEAQDSKSQKDLRQAIELALR